MSKFFTFDTFISENALTIFYAIGVFLIPIVMWIVLFWVLKRYKFLERLSKNSVKAISVMVIVWLIKKIKIFDKYLERKITWKNFSWVQKIKVVGLFLVLVFFAELFYRILFEYLIAFMQMHEALTGK